MRRAFLLLVLLTTVAVSVPLAVAQYPEPASPRMEFWNSLFYQITIVAIIVGVLVWGLLVYALWRFRAKKNGPREGPHIHGNTKMEIAWTIAPAAVMGWLLVVSFNGLFAIEAAPPNPDATIRVEAFQFGFKFTYPDGETASTADQQPLRLEVDRTFYFDITSTDVIHAFSVPELGIMKDAIPGKTTHDATNPTKVGNYTIKCRELCGVGHSYMLGTVVVFPAGMQDKPYGMPSAPQPTAAPNTTTPAPTGNRTNETVPAEAKRVPVTLGPGGALVFNPAQIKVDKGAVAFDMSNPSEQQHNIFIGVAYDTSKPNNGAEFMSRTLNGGESGVFVANFTKDQDYQFWCNVPGHIQGGMKGTLTVGRGGGGVGEKEPLLPGFEPFLLLAALAFVIVIVRRRR